MEYLDVYILIFGFKLWLSFTIGHVQYQSSIPPLGRWWNTLRTIFLIIWLVRPRPHAKYLRTIYPNIPGSFNYSGPFLLYLLTNYCNEYGHPFSDFCVEVNTICILPHAQCQGATTPSWLDVYENNKAIICRCLHPFKG